MTEPPPKLTQAQAAKAARAQALAQALRDNLKRRKAAGGSAKKEPD